MTSEPHTSSRHRRHARTGTAGLGVLVAALAVVLAALTWYFVAIHAPAQRAKAIALWQARLTAMAGDRTIAVEGWVNERLNDVTWLAGDPMFAALAAARPPAGSTGEGAGARRTVAMLENFLRASQSRTVAVLDRNDRTLVHAGDAGLEPGCLAAVHGASAAGASAAFHRHGNGDIVIAFVAPLASSRTGGAVVGHVLVETDPRPFLFAMLERAPMATASAETVLIRRHGGGAQYLSPLRHRAVELLSARANPELERILVAAGRTSEPVSGSFADYRGASVLAVASAIAGTGWVLVAKVDESEALESYRQAIVRNALVLAAALAALLGVGYGIWRRQRAATMNALAASEVRFRQLIEASPNAIFVHRDGRLEFVNPAGARLIGGSSPEALVGMPVFDVVLPENLAATKERLRRLFEEGRPQEAIETRWRRLDGQVINVMVSAAPHRIAGRQHVQLVVQDITARKQAESALRASEERFRAVAETASDGIVTLDTEGRIVFANRAAETIFGATAAAMEGRALAEVVAVDSRTALAYALRRAVDQAERRGPGQSVELAGLRADGREFPVELSFARWEAGGSAFITVIVRDISERTALEERVRQMQKMEAVGQLAGGVAHDFNNLLQAMLSRIHTLRTAAGVPESVARGIHELDHEIRRGAGFTRQLLLFSRQETHQPVRLDLNQVVRELADLLRQLVNGRVEIAFDLAAERVPVEADHSQFDQVLMNLVVNASDAMPSGGRVTIRTGVRGDRAWLAVDDTGPGVPAEIRERIFDPFFTTKSAGKGTGLGLAVVHGIVTRHGGTIEVEDHPGGGAMFRIWLPRVGGAEVAATTAGAVGTPELPAGGSERILVVEDEEGARAGLADVLALLGYRVSAVGSAEEAEHLAGEHNFDLVLTDLLLPGIRGSEFARALQARSPSLKVILMSGYLEHEVWRAQVSAGRWRFLQKPFDAATLAREVRAALDEDTPHGTT
jgi:hypothetical protein